MSAIDCLFDIRRMRCIWNYHQPQHVPDSHSRPWDLRQLDRARETLVTLRVIVLQSDLELDRLEEIPLLLVLRVVEQILDVRAHSSYIGSVSHGTFIYEQLLNVPTVIFDIVKTVSQQIQSTLGTDCALMQERIEVVDERDDFLISGDFGLLVA